MQDKVIIKRMIKLLEPYIKTIIILMLQLIFSVFLGLALPYLNKEIMDKGFLQGEFQLVFLLSFIIFILRQVNTYISLYIEKKRLKIALDFRHKLEKKAFDHLMKVKADYFSHISNSEILNRIDIDISYICSIMNGSTLSVFINVFSIIGGIIGILIIDVKLTLLVFLMLPVKYMIIHIHSKSQKTKLNIFLKKSSSFAKWFSGVVSGILDIRIYGIVKNKEKEFDHFSWEKLSAQKDMDIISQYRQVADSTFDSILNLLIFILGGYCVMNNTLTIGSLFAFISYSAYVVMPLSSILNIKFILSNIIPSAARFFEFLDMEEEPYRNAVNQYDSYGIVINNITFQYNSSINTNKVLKNFSLSIPNQGKTALIGANGSGKSTVMNLILQLYDYNNGEILLGDRSINEFNLQNFREQFSIVSQKIYLFNDSIKNNVCLYQDIEDEAVIQILDKSGLSELVAERGLDFIIGENGSFLSGGQRQKLALSRALAHDRPIFIFDEATSNTDISLDIQFGKLLSNELKDKTVIIITHKPDILKKVDSIAFIDNGQVICQDSYSNLLNKNEQFKKLMEEYEKE